MELTVTQTGNSARIKLKGHVDERGAEELKQKFSQLNLPEAKEIVLDFKEVNRIGSAGIGQLLLFYKNLTSEGGRMQVENLSPTLYELFQGLKLDSLFTITRA